jgi:ribose transport system permease protein
MTDSSRIRKIARWANRQSASIILLILVAYGALGLPNFLTEFNLAAIFYQYSIIGLLALGQLLVILTAGIDLSQGAVVALTSITTAKIMSSYGLLPGVLGGIALATCMGVISGLLVSRTSMPPFLVTLGMLGISRGLAMQIANARPVPVKIPSFNSFGQSSIWGIPSSAFIWAAVCVILYYFLSRRRLGRYIYAVGSNAENSRLSGVNVARVKLTVYTLSAFLTAIAGVIWTARLGSGSPVGGVNYELESIAAVVVGGASLFGGEGTILGTVAGVLIFGVINSILNLLWISPFLQGMIKGAIVLLVVVLSQLRRAR